MTTQTRVIETTNPATGEVLASYDEMSPDQVADILTGVDREYQNWRTSDFATRAAVLTKAAGILRARKGELARLMALEMGKPVAQGEAEAEKCAIVCDYYATNGERFLQPEVVETEAFRSYVAYRPIGVVLAVMPWNFPFWQVFRFIAPNLTAGNGGVLKHASNVMGCALEIEKIMIDAGAPKNVFRTLVIGSKQVAAVIENPIVKAITLTGSTPAGQAIAAKAGSILKKTVLELGGSDPYIILDDADLEQAIDTCVASRLVNSGQSCIAAKRFIVSESLRPRVEELFVQKMAAKRMGDPLVGGVDVGPQARHDLRDELHGQVVESVRKGAKLLIGGEIPNSKGAFYPPTVLTNVRKGMPAYDDELFGPVAAIISVQDEAEALRVANDSPFGLGAAVFTRDLAKGERIAADELEAGNCFVNTNVRSDARLPFGGIKESGYGRELSSFGIREFVNIKTVYVA